MEELIAAGMHWKILNFVIFLSVLFFALQRPVREFWTSRSNGIKLNLDEAERLRREAKERHEAIEKRLGRIESDMTDLIRSIKEEGEMERKKIVEDAGKLAERLREDSEKIASQEGRKARETLKAQAAQISIDLARRLIGEKMTDEDEKNLTERYLSELEKDSERVQSATDSFRAD